MTHYTDTQNTARAIAILRAGRSYDEAATSTGLSIERVVQAWDESQKSSCPSTASDQHPQDPTRAPRT